MKKTEATYTPRIASVTFNTAVMKTDEVLMFIKAAVEAGVDLETAYEDMRLIDDLLHVKHIHFVVHGEIKKTAAGYFRKGTSLYDAYNAIIEGRIKANQEEQE